MYVWRNIVARSRNRCCLGNTQVHSVCCWSISHCQRFKDIECRTTIILWLIYVAGNNNTYAVLHVKCQMFCPISTKFGISWQIFLKKSAISYFTEIHPMGPGLIYADRRTDTTKLTSAFRDCANAPENGWQTLAKQTKDSPVLISIRIDSKGPTTFMR